MPQSPPRLCAKHGLTVTGACPECQKERKALMRQYKDNRPSSRQRGYTTTWEKVRKLKLTQDPLCESCLRNKIKPATLVHHLDENPRNNKIENLMSLCSNCHDLTHKKMAKIPKPKAPVIIVSGPPGAGKSTYINQHKNKDDAVIDIDEIKAELSGKSIYHAGPEWIRPAITERNHRLSSLTTKTWLIVSAPKAADRRQWQKKLNAEVIVLETSLNECTKRINNDDRRPTHIKRQHIEAANKWWSNYVSRPEDKKIG